MNKVGSELEVPDKALEELEACTSYDDAHGAECVRAISRPIVIAELQRLLESGNVAAAALTRLDELEAGL